MNSSNIQPPLATSFAIPLLAGEVEAHTDKLSNETAYPLQAGARVLPNVSASPIPLVLTNDRGLV